MRIQKPIVRAVLRGLRFVGLSAAVAILAGVGATIYAAAPAQTVADGAAPAVVSGETAPAQESEALPASVTTASAQPAPAVKTKSLKVEKVKKVKVKKHKPPKMIAMTVHQGTLTVDGWTGKARLNYDISDLKYIYVWAPGIGTVIASNEKFPMATEQPKAFNLTNLTLTADGHTIQISSADRLLKSKKPVSAWVYVDTTFHRNSGYPEMGYGATKNAPYAWPGVEQAPLDKTGSVDAPDLPVGMRPKMAKPSCAPTAALPGATGLAAVPAGCPGSAPSAKPAAMPPVPLPGYRSGTTTAQVKEPGAVQ